MRHRPRRLTASTPTVSRLVVADGRVTAADPAARTITGRVVEWGASGHTSIGLARFQRGSITASDPSRVRLLVEHDPERPIGILTSSEDREDGLYGTFRVPAGALGDEMLAAAASGLRDGLSVGVDVEQAAPDAAGVLTVTASAMRETSIVTIPAFGGARVTEIAASGQQPAGALVPAAPAQITGAGRLAAAPAGPGFQARRPTTPAALDDQFSRIAAGWRQGGAEGALRAALTDIVPPPPGDQRDALFRPQWLGQLWDAVYNERPLIDSISRGRLTSFTVSGFRVNRPAFGVDVYAGNKAPVPSPGDFSVEPVTDTATRIAGAHDIDRAFIDLGDASFISQYFQFQAENYAALTEEQIGAWLLAEASTIANTPGDPLEALDVLARYFSRLGSGARGARLSFIALSGDIWSQLISIRQLDAPWLFGGRAEIEGSIAVVGGVRMFLHEPLPDNTILAGDRRAATFFEWQNPPLAVQAVNVANGGVDLGVFGYVARIVSSPRALVKLSLDTAPGAPEAAVARRKAAAK